MANRTLRNVDGTTRVETDHGGTVRTQQFSLPERIAGEDPANARMVMGFKFVQGDAVLEVSQNAVAIAADGTAVDVAGYSSIACIISAYNNITVHFEATFDDVAYFPLPLTPLAGGAAVTSATHPATAAGVYYLATPMPISKVRTRTSAPGGAATATTYFRKQPR